MASLFNTSNNIGVSGNDLYSTKYVIKGADLQKSVEIASGGKGEFIQSDEFGNMLGRINIAAVYSPENNTCSITTTTTMCKNAEAVIEHTNECFYAGIQVMGGAGSCNDKNGKGKSGGGGGLGSISAGAVIKKEHYAGNNCTEFGVPEITTQSIKM